MARLSSSALCVLAAFAAAGAAGCSDAGTSPTAAPGVVEAPSFHRAAGHLRTGKYRDSGARPATGRSGSAVLSARAVLWRDGVVRLLVTTGDLDHPEAAPGELAKVQLKVFSPEGGLLSTTNYQRPSRGGSHLFLLPGLVPGSRIQVQANVRGIDRNRTDVVTLTETVKPAPSLAAVLDPITAVAGVPTVITASVTETGGVTGTYTTCTLYVDGVAVDSIRDVWVDAGDEVTCAFTHTFDREGSYDVSVLLGDGGGDTGTLLPEPTQVTVEVTDPTPTPSYTASVLDRTVATEVRFDQRWERLDGTWREYSHNNGEASRSQTASLTGTLTRAAVLPLATVRLRLSSTVSEWQTAAWSGVADATVDAAGRSCVNRMVPEHGGHFHLCTVDGTTTYGYTRFAGTVTYHSIGFVRTWDGLTGETTYWSWNEVAETYSSGGQHRPLGTAVTLELEIVDGLGTMGATATVPVAYFEEPATGTPYTCRDESPWWLEGGVMTTCESDSGRVFGWRGEVSG
jgi:hypothetical protein